MSNEFTYKLPEPKKFLQYLRKFVADERRSDYVSEDKVLSTCLTNATCSFENTGQYSRCGRWDEVIAIMTLYFDYDSFLMISENSKLKNRLEGHINRIIPESSGFLVRININLNIETEDCLASNILESISQVPCLKYDNADLYNIGVEMADVYLSIYYFENTMRKFIDQIFQEHYGHDYALSNLISSSIMREINTRKQKDEANVWLNARGESDLFYLDFKDISSVITANWSIFEQYFPGQNWIKVKLDEIGLVRNLVAHNSYVSESGKNTVKTNCGNILQQINAKNSIRP